MRRARPPIKHAAAGRRQAATLAEVLVSIMILSIGILSLATLFPISILRSLQATQLTNATILKINAETAIDVFTQGAGGDNIVHDPDGDGTANAPENYVVDPLGFARSNGSANLGGVNRYRGLERFDPAFVDQTTAESNALAAVTLRDSWILHYEGVPSASTLTSVTLPAEDVPSVVNMTQLDTMLNSGIAIRIMLFDAAGNGSQVRILPGPPASPISGNTISWSNALPSTGYGTVSRVRIEVQQFRYTWMLTVRNNASNVANVDIIVFFQRPDPPAGETRYAASFTKNSQSATISYSDEEPALKKGGYVMDATNARWYRIQNITKTAGGATLQLDRPAIDAGNAAIVMEGVVQVYAIGEKFPPL